MATSPTTIPTSVKASAVQAALASLGIDSRWLITAALGPFEISVTYQRHDERGYPVPIYPDRIATQVVTIAVEEGR